MKDQSGMPEMEPVNGTDCAQRQPRCGGFREHTLMAFAFIGCVCSGEVLAKDRPLGADASLKPGAESSAPFALSVPFDEPRAFSATEFRPRRPALAGADPAKREVFIIDAPMLDTSVARQLRESKTQDRVRLLTLWRSSASSVSLQAGKHGMPSLQWSTPWMHRDVASRGLFDRFLTVSPRSGGGGGSGGSRGILPRQTGAFAASKPADLNASHNIK
jgi:hypothetical protein